MIMIFMQSDVTTCIQGSDNLFVWFTEAAVIATGPVAVFFLLLLLYQFSFNNLLERLQGREINVYRKKSRSEKGLKVFFLILSLCLLFWSIFFLPTLFEPMLYGFPMEVSFL